MTGFRARLQDIVCAVETEVLNMQTNELWARKSQNEVLCISSDISICVLRLGNKQKSVTSQLISLYFYVIFTNKHSILSNPTTAIFAHYYNGRAKHKH
jgi:peroxiredoxin